MRTSLPLLALAATLLAPTGATAQVLRLGDALERADQHAFGNRAQRAMAAASDATARLPLRGILPAVRIDAGLVHTTDPIGAFGTTLRQRTITQQDFDPTRLNFPDAARNVVGAVVVEQPLFNGDAWAGRRAATRAADAASATADWTRTATRTNVIRAYFGAMLASEHVTAYAAGLRAGQAHVRQAESMFTNGMVTASDALLATVKAGEVETGLLKAQGDAANARRALLTLLGDATTSVELPPSLPDAAAVRDLVRTLSQDTTTLPRADVSAATAQRSAADADLLRAKSGFIPRVNSFARYDWNDPRRAFGGEKNWTVGVMASWALFTGGTELSETQAATSRLRAATAMADGATAQAALEAAQSSTALETALARLTIAERSVTQAADAHRIVARRYAGGLATIIELFDASAMETQTQLAASAARYDVIVALAQHLQATGRDPGALRLLDSPR
jgi:outer membrane protein TolC